MDTRSDGARLVARSGNAAGRPVEQVPDEALVTQALGGDRRAFESLVRRHQRALVNHLFRLTGQSEEAIDLAQEVFIKIYLSLDTFDAKYRFTTWLYRIASNCAIDYLRKRQPRTCPLADGAANESGPGEREPAALNRPGPLEAARLRELEARLERAIQSLPLEYRHLILLRHRQHCRYDEIVRITGLPMGTVKNRIFRAREILKKELADYLDREA